LRTANFIGDALYDTKYSTKHDTGHEDMAYYAEFKKEQIPAR
jgi:hypothetical protein